MHTSSRNNSSNSSTTNAYQFKVLSLDKHDDSRESALRAKSLNNNNDEFNFVLKEHSRKHNVYKNVSEKQKDNRPKDRNKSTSASKRLIKSKCKPNKINDSNVSEEYMINQVRSEKKITTKITGNTRKK